MILSVQYMRAIAALLVLITHSATKGAQYSNDPMGWFHIGGIGVDLFFIISGFIMCHTTASRNIDFSYFIKARFIRIMPLYWFLTIIALIGFIAFPGKINSSGGNTSIINSFTLFPTEDKLLINNGWTLSYEFFFYFVFGAGLYFSEKYKRIMPGILIMLLALIGLLLKSSHYLIGFLTSPLLLNFVFGIITFEVFKKINYKPVLALVCIPLSLLLITNVNSNGGVNIRLIDYSFPAFLFFIGMVNLEPLLIRFKSNIVSHIFKNIGDSSYSLYLIHPFILVACALVLQKIGVNAYGYIFVTLLIICSVIGGHLCYLFLEKNLLLILRRRVGNLRASEA